MALFWSFKIFAFLIAVSLSLLATMRCFKSLLPLHWKRILKNLASSPIHGKPHPKYPVELWTWETSEDESVCEDCRERAAWPPMDIADWMKEGIPGTPESECACGDDCRCRLIPYKASLFSRR